MYFASSTDLTLEAEPPFVAPTEESLSGRSGVVISVPAFGSLW
jgi:hypothetical protein